MRGTIRFAVLTLAALLVAARPAAAQYPAEPGDGIADLANVLTPADAQTVRDALYRLRENPGVEVRVLTVQSIDAYRTGARSPEAFATGVYNDWKLGYGQRQDGVLVLLSLDDRFTRIELGDNVPADKDAQVRAIVDDVMVPRFRSGDMSGGLREGVLAVARAFGAPAGPLPSEAPDPNADPSRLSSPQTQTVDQPQPAYQTPDRPSSPYDVPLNTSAAPLFVLLVIVAAGFGVVVLIRNSRRKCPHCRAEVQRVAEHEDDVYLDSGRRLEEVLGSVNYTVWKCPSCGNHEIQRSARWFSGKEPCPQCKYHTVSVDRETLESPTYDSPGRQRLERKCAHCSWHDVDIIHLPRRQRPAPSTSSGSRSSLGGSWGSGSSSSSSRRSSGGGGRSSGGGHSSGRGSSGRW